MKMKYIIVEIDGKRVPVIFGEALSHKAVFMGLQYGVRVDSRGSGRGWESPELVSAGFVEGLTALGTHGESESLRYGEGYIEDHELTKAHEGDIEVINQGKHVRSLDIVVESTNRPSTREIPQAPGRHEYKDSSQISKRYADGQIATATTEEAVIDAAATPFSAATHLRIKNMTHAANLLRGKTDETRHMSANQRKQTAINYAKIHLQDDITQFGEGKLIKMLYACQ